MSTAMARIADKSLDESSDESSAEAIADVQMEALAEEMMPEEVMTAEMMADESECEAEDSEMADATVEKCPVMDMTVEELADFVAVSNLCEHVDFEDPEVMEGFTLEEMSLSHEDLIAVLQCHMEEVGDSITEFPAFMSFLIENGLYTQVDQAPAANDEAPVAQVTSEAKNSNTRQKTSVLISRLKDVIKTGKKHNSNVMLDEEEIEHHRKMLKTIEKAGQVFLGF